MNFHAGQGGALEPIMCVDKTLDELGSFADLVTESESMDLNWQLVMVASLSGRNGIAPTSGEATQPLKNMVQTVQTGGDLSRFLAFNKEGDPIYFGN